MFDKRVLPLTLVESNQVNYEGILLLDFVILTRTFSFAMCFFAGVFVLSSWVLHVMCYRICKPAEFASHCTSS